MSYKHFAALGNGLGSRKQVGFTSECELSTVIACTQAVFWGRMPIVASCRQVCSLGVDALSRGIHGRCRTIILIYITTDYHNNKTSLSASMAKQSFLKFRSRQARLETFSAFFLVSFWALVFVIAIFGILISRSLRMHTAVPPRIDLNIYVIVDGLDPCFGIDE